MTTLTFEDTLPPGICALYREMIAQSNHDEVQMPGEGGEDMTFLVTDFLLKFGFHPERYPHIDLKTFDESCMRAALMMRRIPPAHEA